MACFSSPEVAPRIRALDVPLVMFSNQKGLSQKGENGDALRRTFLDRVDGFGAALDVPFLFLGAVADDAHHKPRTGMWKLATALFGERAPRVGAIDLAQCFYMGDAAGRPAGWRRGAGTTFSDSYHKSAVNLGIEFRTPEQYFQDARDVPDMISKALPLKSLAQRMDPALLPADLFRTSGDDAPEIVLFCGRAGSGKTSFYRKHFAPKNYVHINKDKLGSAAKYLRVLKDAVSLGRLAVVDETNPSRKSRKQYLDVAAALSVPARCVHFSLERALCEHLNRFRHAVTDWCRTVVPAITYNIFEINFETPDAREEGFVRVSDVSFVVSFESEEHRRLFQEYYC